jgi:hypothetical protein
MKFFFWHGVQDTKFDQKETFELYNKLFTKVGIKNTIKEMHAQKGLGHEISHAGLVDMTKFIKDQPITTEEEEANIVEQTEFLQ